MEEFFRSIGITKPVHIIPNPVELDIFKSIHLTPEEKSAFRKKYGVQDDDMLVCFCGRLGREKSVDILLKYWAEHVKPTDKMKLFIIGDGPSHQELQELATQLGIQNMVIFVGKVMHSDIAPYYACCDLYITASLSDTNSISMLEGMATGLPVLHIYDELNTGQVRPGVNGDIYRNSKEMYSLLQKYRDMPAEEMQALRQSVQASVETAGAEDLARNLLAVYEECLSEWDPDEKK